MSSVYQKHLDSSTPSNDSNLEISGYTLVRSDHSSNNKRGGFCICYKRFLPLRILNVQYLQESICFELKIFDLSTHPQAKVKMTLELLLKTLNQI